MKVFLITILLFSSNSIYSAEWNIAGKITSIYPKPSRNGIYIKHESMVKGDCGSTTPIWLFLSKENPLYSEIYSAILSSYMASQNITLLSGSCQPGFKYPQITEIRLTRP